MNQEKKSIGIIFGGKSGEHKVSIQSAKTIIKALKSEKNKKLFEVIPLYIDLEGNWLSSEIAEKILRSNQISKDIITYKNNNSEISFHFPSDCKNVDIWFPVIHGPNGEDGTIQGLLTLMGKQFIGSGILGSAIGMDKIAMKAIFKSENIPQAPYLEINSNQFLDDNFMPSIVQTVIEKIGFPCFIKPANLGSSVGITKAYKNEELINGLKYAASFDQRIVIEKNILARELECAVLGKQKMRTSVVGEISFDSDWYDYEAKYSKGLSSTLIPASLSKKVSERVQALSIKACKAIGAYGLARVDFFYQESSDTLLVNEINTLPGFTTTSMYPMLWEASGLSIENLVAQIIKTARE